MTKQEITEFELETLELLKNVMDPEIEINSVDLGLIYKLNFVQKHPSFCVNINVVFEPKWSTALVSEEGKKLLGL